MILYFGIDCEIGASDFHLVIIIIIKKKGKPTLGSAAQGAEAGSMEKRRLKAHMYSHASPGRNRKTFCFFSNQYQETLPRLVGFFVKVNLGKRKKKL